jgi:hypothetical protein
MSIIVLSKKSSKEKEDKTNLQRETIRIKKWIQLAV